ncbi:hypothetical protein RUM44_002077 [Polyplax serrata]|uniref:Uncharacterized protein n=1 Tax=Polyplax serrata TaxID=468196 RepID=A0ABR1ALV2_POLSC
MCENNQDEGLTNKRFNKFKCDFIPLNLFHGSTPAFTHGCPPSAPKNRLKFTTETDVVLSPRQILQLPKLLVPESGADAESTQRASDSIRLLPQIAPAADLLRIFSHIKPEDLNLSSSSFLIVFGVLLVSHVNVRYRVLEAIDFQGLFGNRTYFCQRLTMAEPVGGPSTATL